jgi:hypothetical protein
MMSRVVGLSPESVVIGMQVRARIDVLDDMLAVLFERVTVKAP